MEHAKDESINFGNLLEESLKGTSRDLSDVFLPLVINPMVTLRLYASYH